MGQREDEKKPIDSDGKQDFHCKGSRNSESVCKLWKKWASGKGENRNQSCRRGGWH